MPNSIPRRLPADYYKEQSDSNSALITGLDSRASVDQWAVKRKKEYTEKGIKRLACIRCGEPAVYQWQICADGNNYRPLCANCDIELNSTVLEFMKHPEGDKLIIAYRETRARI